MSQLKRNNQVRNIGYLARLWVEEQKKIFYHSKIECFDEYLLIRYEDFISQEDAMLSEVTQFLQVSRSRIKSQLFNTEDTKIHEWQNLNKATLKNNKDLYKGALTQNKIRKIEAICTVYMKLFGYLEPTRIARNANETFFEKVSVIFAKLILVIKVRFKLIKEVNGYSKMRSYLNSLPK